jgi:hypothetical protein
MIFNDIGGLRYHFNIISISINSCEFQCQYHVQYHFGKFIFLLCWRVCRGGCREECWGNTWEGCRGGCRGIAGRRGMRGRMPGRTPGGMPGGMLGGMAGECREIVVDDADNKWFFYTIPTLRRQVGGLGLKCNSRRQPDQDPKPKSLRPKARVKQPR